MRTHVVAACVCLILLGFGTTAKADTVYTYTGNPFTSFGGVEHCPPECSISGSFTVAAPLLNLTLAASGGNVTPLSWSFTDGNATLTQANTDPGLFHFNLQTDGSGAITAWSVFLASSGGDTIGLGTDSGLIDLSNYEANSPFGLGAAQNSNDQGTWTMSSTTTAAPEPSSVVLLLAGLLGLALVARRRVWSDRTA